MASQGYLLPLTLDPWQAMTLDLTQAQTLVNNYPGSVMEEMG